MNYGLSFIEVICAIFFSVFFTASFAVWFSKKFIENRLMLLLEIEKNKLSEVLEKNKIYLQGEVKKRVDNELGDEAAERKYAFDAKQRLYNVVGPMRFKLLVGCRDFVDRINDIAKYRVDEHMRFDDYFCLSTAYRFVLPFVLLELIENEVYYADFSIDKEMVDILRFKKSAYRAMKSDKPILGHPGEVWDKEIQHLNGHTIQSIAGRLVVKKGDNYRPMFFDEFLYYLQSEDGRYVRNKLLLLFNGFNVRHKPVLWLRFVFFAYLCSFMVNKIGIKIGFEMKSLSVINMLNLTNDEHIRQNITKLCTNFEDIMKEGL